MNKVKFYIIGVLFGLVMTKSEIISWLRIYEMFKFEAFHMYRVIGSSVVLGIIVVQIIKKFRIKSMVGSGIKLAPKEKGFSRYMFGGIIFGLGWAMTGACPGPMFTLVGNGFLVMLVVILSATFGTFVYGMVKDKLPH
jgi:uncharacterized membrane protein YedE/YeeE